VLRARGAVSLVSLFLLLVLVAAGYAGWTYIPLYMDNLEMREAMTAAFNRMGSDPDDERIRIYLLGRASKIGTHWERENGVRVEKPGLGLTAADLIIERESFTGHNGRLQVDYQREYRLWPTDTFKVLDFHLEKAGALAQ
jgi:hypothetical protein